MHSPPSVTTSIDCAAFWTQGVWIAFDVAGVVVVVKGRGA
jgi:hypothetical protein